MAIDPKISLTDVASYLNLTVQAVHKRAKTMGLKERKSSNKIIFSHDATRKIISPKVNQIKLATAVVKGGVGKTTITEALAIRMALYGLRVLCIDLDQQANLTKGFGMDNEAKDLPVMIDIIAEKTDPKESILHVIPGLDLIPSRLDNVTLDGYMMLNRVNPSFILDKTFSDVFTGYDVIIFDCPPTLGTPVCAAMLCADYVITPLNPDVYSYDGIEIMDKEFQNIYEQYNQKINWKILLNKFDSRTILSTDYISHLIKDKDLSTKLLTSVIRTSQDFPNSKNKGKSIFDSLKKSTAKEDIDALTREIMALMKIDCFSEIEKASSEKMQTIEE